MTEKLTEYLDSLIIKVKRLGNFENTVFYRAFDGIPVPSEPEGFSVCAGVNKVTTERRFFSIYKRRRNAVIKAGLEFKVSVATETEGLGAFCGRLEKLLREADPIGIMSTAISAPRYDEDMNAVYRTVTAEVKFGIRN